MQTTIVMLLCSIVVPPSSSAPAPAAPRPSEAKRYENMLYELGAFPVSRLTRPYWTNGHPGQVWSKGTREDVDGWLPPRTAPQYLTDAEKTANNLPKKPLPYARYAAMLNVDTYQRTHNPLLLLVMRFALQELAFHRPPGMRKQDILRVYEAQVGLEDAAVPALDGLLSPEDIIRLVRKYHDQRLVSVFPPPQPSQRDYIDLLSNLAEDKIWHVHRRQSIYKLLLAMDEQAYHQAYAAFLLTNVKTTQDWWERKLLYAALARLDDARSLEGIRTGLLNDPVTECREAILAALQEQPDVSRTIDAVDAMARQDPRRHWPCMPSRGAGQWYDNLRKYLLWASQCKGLDPLTVQKVADTLKYLDSRPTTGEP